MTGRDLATVAVFCLLASPANADEGRDGGADAPAIEPDGVTASSTAPGPTEGAEATPGPAPRGAGQPGGEPAPSGPELDTLRDSVDLDIAPPESFEGLSLEEILNMQVVTATGEEEDRALAPANVLVVTREDIAFHGYRSMAELLAGVPGLFVVDDLVSPSLAVNGISGGLRGGTRIVRTMINGVEVNFRPDLTAFLGPEYIPMDAIERVEIATGPLSALYGANAFLATVNVITRVPPTGTSSMIAVRSSRLGATGLGTSGSIGFNDGRRSFFASFVFDQLDRSGMSLQQTFPGQDLTPALFQNRSQNDIRQSVGAFASFHASDERLGALSIQGGLQSFDAGTEFQINSLFSHVSRLALYNGWSNALWERTWSRLLQTSASIGWSQGGPTRDTELYLPDSRAVVFKPNYSYGALTGKLEVGLAPGRALSLAVGIDAEEERQRILYYTQVFNVAVGQNQPGDQVDAGIAPTDPHHVTVRNLGGYLKAGLAPLPDRLPDLRLTGNARADVIEQGPVSFPWQTSWRLAVANRFSPGISAKVIAGRAFQVPSAVLNFARPGYGTIGNIVGVANVAGADPLRPQRVTSLQTVVSARLLGRFAVEGEAYYQDVKDRIEFVRYGSNYRAANQGDTSQLGLAGVLRFVERPVSLYVAGNVLRDVVGGQLSDQPPSGFPSATATIGANVDLPGQNLRFNTETRYVGVRGASQANVTVNNQEPYTLPAYAQTDLTVSINLHPLGVGTETTLLFGVRNLFDVRFNEPGYGGFDIPGMGRLMFIEARQAF